MSNALSVSVSEFQAILRNDLTSFIERSFYELNPQANFQPSPYIELLAATLEKCRAGQTKRLIINLPPRTLKSHAATVAFSAWLLGHEPTNQIICASYGQDLADKHARDCRTLIGSGFYRRLFPRTVLSEAKQSVNDFMTTQQGFRMATSVGGVLTGRGAGVIILDDILKPEDALSETRRRAANDWYFNTLLSRLNSKEHGVIVIVMQRLHQEDLVGEVTEKEPWEVLSLPAIATDEECYPYRSLLGEHTFTRKTGDALHPERDSVETYRKIRESIGEYNFESQYQQSPIPREGGLIKRDWLRFYSPDEKPKNFRMIVQSWDTANKAGELNDYSVCTTWGTRNARFGIEASAFGQARSVLCQTTRRIMSHSRHWLAMLRCARKQVLYRLSSPEVLMEGEHSLERCSEVTEAVLREVFSQLYTQGVILEGMILKPNMVLPGSDCPTQEALEEVADATMNCLLRAVPAAVPAIAFLSGGQSAELASARLNAMHVRFKSRLSWALAFSFARAIQQPALELWKGLDANVSAAQRA